jgi:Protein of unknown function (DUF3631)/Domain of unknown function (DUF3854)
MDVHLHPDHLADLHRSGLTAPTIAMMGCRSVRPADIDKLLKGGLKGIESALEFPYPSLTPSSVGFSRYKLWPPLVEADGGVMKYFQRKGSGCHLYILEPVKKVLSDPSINLLIVEGEKKSASAVQNGKLALGLGGIWNWLESETGNGIQELDLINWVDRHVDVSFDSDVWQKINCHRALYALMRELEDRGAIVKAVVIPGNGEQKQGLDDFVVANGIAAFDNLKRIDLNHRALKRHSDWWKRWKAKKEEAVRKEEKKEGKSDQDNTLNLEAPRPWPEPVNGAELLDGIRAAIKRFIVLPEDSITAESLWIVFAHAIDAFGIAPMLTFSSAVRQCGKSVNQAIVRTLTPKPLTTTNISPAALFRVVEKFSPTLIVDECDSAFKSNPDLRELVNASHLRTQAYVCRTVGEDHEPSLFCTWCAKCLALIGHLPDTTASRSIIIPMQRKTKKDKAERLSAVKKYPELEALRRQAARWAADNIAELGTVDPEVLADANDRDTDNWIPLFTIADRAGDEWPELARKAARALSGAPAEESRSIELLKDLEIIFHGDPQDPTDEGCESISSANLVLVLNNKEDRPWADHNNGKGITTNQVARLIKAFGIPTNRTIRHEKKTFKGYLAEWFTDAFDRYLDRDPPEGQSQQSQDSKNAALGGISHQSQTDNVTDTRKDINNRKDIGVTDVTDNEANGAWEEL